MAITRSPRQPITASSGGVTNAARSRTTQGTKTAAIMASLSPEKQRFVRQIASTYRKMQPITAATNTVNIMARPDFLELLPVFVQQLLILDVYGSVAMKSRQQLVPYFKVVADIDKGETLRGDIMNSPFVNRQGIDPNFTGRTVKNEFIETEAGAFTVGSLNFFPVLPGSVTISSVLAGVSTPYTDDGMGNLVDGAGDPVGTIAYDDGTIDLTDANITLADGDMVKASAYQYDNETVGPDPAGNHGARMGKMSLQLDEFQLIAEAHQLASYWSVYSAFAAQTEYGAAIGDMSKEAAFAEMTAEINTKGFLELEKAAQYRPQFNWDATPVLSGSVVPSDYLNMFRLKLGQAAASIYQATRLTRANRMVVGTNTAEYLKMLEGMKVGSISDTVGPYKLGSLDEFDIYVEPNMDPNKWVMSCKSNDIRRNSGLFGEYMPFVNTGALGLANMSVQEGYATMYALKIVNPQTVVSGKILGVF